MFLIRWLGNLSVSKKFYIIIGCILFMLLFGLGSFWMAMTTMSSIRAYVAGEGLWSKAQKEATISLGKYATSYDQADYEDFIEFLEIPLGDKQARLELEKPEPDLTIARQGFLDGGNHPDDIDNLIFLFRRFRTVSYLDAAIQVWTKGDALIEQLIELGDTMHTIIGASDAPLDASEQAILDRQLAPLIEENETIDTRLTILENEFSATLGEGSRSITSILLILMVALSSLFGIFVLFIALFIARTVTQVDAAKSEFVAMVSHQLRTPLTLIKWSIERLRKIDLSALTSPARDDIETIQLETKRMAALISDILDTSRMEAGTLVVQPYEIDLVAATKTILAEVRPSAHEKGLKVEESYPESLVTLADPTLLQVIFMNLLSNAIKYTQRGGTIRVSLEKDPRGVLITVADTGNGISAEEQSYVFDKLFRGKNAARTDPVGTGIGLFLVKSIVTKAGGTIWFSSEEGKGTTFYVRLPPVGMRTHKGNIHLSNPLQRDR